ncbi:MAG: hypothetical protein M0P13_00090 [Fibrobacteraceae bacterium]|nr:hypothetical protein [Fibrobacteraceae bacterium]
MRQLIGILLCIAFFSAPSFAGFFLDSDEDVVEKSAISEPGFFFGGGGSASYYLGAVDLALEGLAAYRFASDYTCAMNLSVGVSGLVDELGIELRKSFDEFDYFGLGVSGLLYRRDGELEKSPRISVAYGRNSLPWKNAHFAFATSIRLSYIIGGSLGREQTYITKTASTVIDGKIILIFF